MLITGASGGVGVFAVQLAHRWGAHVTAALHSDAFGATARRLGATELATGPDLSNAKGRFDLILESVGGKTLGAALGLLAPGGAVVLFGASEISVTTFDARAFRAGGTSLYGFLLGYELQRDPPGPALAELAGMIAGGTLDPMIEVEAPWTDIAQVAADLMARTFTGKAVLRVE